MNNFVYQNPTQLVFGKGQIASLTKYLAEYDNILMTYGGGSIFKNGVYDQVKEALVGKNITEFGGIEANPDYATLMKAITICKEQKIDFVLAVGGGSVIDGSKFIVCGAEYDGDPWDFLVGGVYPKANLPLGTVLTLPATGSEMNNGAVVSRRERGEKFPFYSPAYPKFSILDPEAIYSLPTNQVANGIIDTYAHTLEQYLTTDLDTKVMDRWAEGILHTLIEIAPSLMVERNYDDCANFMIAATTGLNGYIAWGNDQDWTTHMIGHELTALHGLDHGHTLAIVYPGVMRNCKEEKRSKLLRYAERVWNITEGDEEARIEAAVCKTEEFFRSLGKQIKLSENGIGDDTINEIVSRFETRGVVLGENKAVTPDRVRVILESVK